MQKDIKHTWLLNSPPEKVWEHLTDAELLSEWLMKNDFKPIIGHKFQFYAKPVVNMGFDGNVYCQVLEIIPLKKLSYSWKGGPGKGKITLDSVVTWTLIEKDNATELTIEHTGFKGLKNFVGYFFMNSGWKSIIKKRLGDLLNS
ncbi:MAG: SRPBCC domain-containing protein [Bacteroidota bacterium]